jgi:hypothetical protein
VIADSTTGQVSRNLSGLTKEDPMAHSITRREFLRLSALAASGTVLSACTFRDATPTTHSAPAPTSIAAAPTRARLPTHTPAGPAIPSEFKSLYTELDTSLTAFNQSFDASGTQNPVIFAAELLPANGNRGAALLEPQALQGVRANLDHLQAIGVRGVTVALSYPLLTPDFPRSAEYLAFFKTVADEVRRRGMKLDTENGPIFPPPFSSLPVSYGNLTFDKFKTTKRQMVAIIIDEIQPDYLDLGAEPDTQAAITRIREINTPQGYVDLVNYVLWGLNRGSTKIGAGSGTWGSPEIVRHLAANTSLDFIALHIYPVTGRALQNAVAMSDLARQYNKRVVLDEAWLYKTSANEPPTSIAANAEIFRRDAYRFWAPLDQKFLATISKLAHTKNIEYVSAFWTTHLFAYLDYDPQLQTIPYNDLMAQLSAQAAKDMLVGKFSTTGEFYQRLIASQP